LGVSVAFVYLGAAFVARALLPAFFGFHVFLRFKRQVLNFLALPSTAKTKQALP
jgi:hypothetical protein